MKKRFITLLFILGISLNARNIYVDNLKGSDSNTGSKQFPFKTIKRGVKELQAGETLFLTANSEPYFESLIIKNIQGTIDKPVIIDGQKSVLSGARRLNNKSWKHLKDSIYVRKVKKGFRSKRYFMIVNGKPQRMGTYYKLKRPAFKKVEELKAGEWTFDKTRKELYIKLAPDEKLNEVYEPVNNPHSGVMIIGNSGHIVVRNMTVKNFINDGYNIHGKCKNISFRNVVARDCGDDGVSAHGDCDIKVKNFISDGNPSAICHVDRAIARHENILIINTAGVNLLLLNSKNFFENLIVKSPGNLDFIKGEIILKNGFFEHHGKKKPTVNFKTGKLKFHNVLAKSYRIKNKPSGLILFTEQNMKEFNKDFVAKTLNELSFLSE